MLNEKVTRMTILRCLMEFSVLKEKGEKQNFLALLDSGASTNVLSLSHPLARQNKLHRSDTKIRGLGETSVSVVGEIHCEILVGTDSRKHSIRFVVITNESPVLLSLNFLRQAELTLNREGIFDVNQIVLPRSSFSSQIYHGSYYGYAYNIMNEPDGGSRSDSWVAAEFDMTEVFDTTGSDAKELTTDELEIGVDDPNIRAEIKQLITDFKLIRSKSSAIPTVPDYVMHQTFTAEPIEVQSHRLTPEGEEHMQLEIDKMEKQEVIEECTNPAAFASMAIFLIKKRETGEYRFICDSRKTNLITQPIDQHIPNLERITASIGTNAKLFSSVDISKAFWSLRIDSNAKRYYRFRSPEGKLYQFLRAPMGGLNSPSQFQIFMKKLLGNLKYRTARLTIYLDDIIVSSENIEDHLVLLRKIFVTLGKAKLTINRKCTFLQPRVKVFGYIIDQTGRIPDPSRVIDLTNMAKPNTIGELQKVVCSLNYYRQNFGTKWATILKPLYTEISKYDKKDKVKWSPDLTDSYEKMVKCAANCIKLANVDCNKPFILHSDASISGIGATLAQVGPDGEERPVAVYSRHLTKAERAYSINFLELRSVQNTLERFKDIINGQKVTIMTDSSWTYFTLRAQEFKSAGSRSMLIRMLIFISQFQYDVKHVKGLSESHMLCDLLSRTNLEAKNQDSYFMLNKDPKKNPISVIFEENVNTVYKVSFETLKYDNDFYDKIKQGQALDTKLNRIRIILTGKFNPCRHKSKRICDVPECVMFRRKEELRGKYDIGSINNVDDLVMLKCTPTNLIMLPDNLKYSVLKEIHSKTHGSGRDLRKKITEMKLICNQITETLVNVITTCDTCNITKQSKTMKSNTSQQPIPTGPFTDIGADVCSVGIGINARYILCITCNFSKHIMAFYLEKQDAIHTRICFSSYMGFFGCPAIIRTDNGTNFTSKEFAHYLAALNIVHKRISPRNSRANSRNELSVKKFQDNMRKLELDENCSLEDFKLGINLATILCNMQQTGEQIPSTELLFGRVHNVTYFTPIARTTLRDASPSLKSFHREIMLKQDQLLKT